MCILRKNLEVTEIVGLDLKSSFYITIKYESSIILKDRIEPLEKI